MTVSYSDASKMNFYILPSFLLIRENPENSGKMLSEVENEMTVKWNTPET